MAGSAQFGLSVEPALVAVTDEHHGEKSALARAGYLFGFQSSLLPLELARLSPTASSRWPINRGRGTTSARSRHVGLANMGRAVAEI